LFQEDSNPQLSSFPPLQRRDSDPRRSSSWAPVKPANPLQPVLTDAHSLSKTVPIKNHKPNCPVLEAEGIDWESSEGVDICVNCSLPQCVFDDGLKPVYSQRIRARNKEISHLNKLNGTSVEELANMFGLSTRTVERVLNHQK